MKPSPKPSAQKSIAKRASPADIVKAARDVDRRMADPIGSTVAHALAMNCGTSAAMSAALSSWANERSRDPKNITQDDAKILIAGLQVINQGVVEQAKASHEQLDPGSDARIISPIGGGHSALTLTAAEYQSHGATKQ